MRHVPVGPPDRPVTSCFLNSTLSPRRTCGRCAPRGEHISTRFVPHHDGVEPCNRRAPCAHTLRAAVSQHNQIMTCTPRLAQWIKFMSGRKPRKESELKMQNTVHNLSATL